jgi:mono/diheme cytochrome c family protein
MKCRESSGPEDKLSKSPSRRDERRPSLNSRIKRGALCVVAVWVACAGCKPQMGDQPRYEAYEASDFFPDGAAMRPLPAHTVARGHLQADDIFFTGMRNGKLVAEIPGQITTAMIERGRERFNIHCAVCHGLSGAGDGMIVQRGFPTPPSFHGDRLRAAPAGHFFDVITRGYGVMYPYASRVPPEDRWAIVAYVRAIQLSQNATLADVPATERGKLETKEPP